MFLTHHQHDAGMLHLRHPNEMGGAYWLFNMSYTQISMFVMLSLGTTAKDSVIQLSDLRIIAISLVGLWLTSIVSLLAFGEKDYKNTFYNKLTCGQFQVKRFHEGNDLTKITILTTVHQAIWKKIEWEMKDWLSGVWNELHQTKPKWFGNDVVRKIPLDFIPHSNHESIREEMGKENITERAKRRRSSATVIIDAVVMT